MLFRITVKLDTTERNALASLAKEELRSLPDQIRSIIREELMRKGFLPTAGTLDHQDQKSRSDIYGRENIELS